MVTWSQCVKATCSSKWVPNLCVYNGIFMYLCMSLVHVHVIGIQMMYCALFHGPDRVSRIAHVHEERGQGREGNDNYVYMWFMRLMYT